MLAITNAAHVSATLSRCGYVTKQKPFSGGREVPGMPERAMEFPWLLRSSHGRIGD
jgi:hypothetical protein